MQKNKHRPLATFDIVQPNAFDVQKMARWGIEPLGPSGKLAVDQCCRRKKAANGNSSGKNRMPA